jgi:hypothetical protein
MRCRQRFLQWRIIKIAIFSSGKIGDLAEAKDRQLSECDTQYVWKGGFIMSNKVGLMTIILGIGLLMNSGCALLVGGDCCLPQRRIENE